MIESEPHTETEFSVVFEERVAPRRAATLIVRGVRRCRQVAAVNTRAPSRISNDGAVAKELCQQFDIRCFPATGARARELKQRL